MKPNFKILDGLRGIAATYVLINHSRGNLLMGGNEFAKITPLADWNIFQKLYYSALQLTSLGREFVILFFILSGFSIAYSLQKKTPILNFYSRRFIRLYPPYIMALIWAGVVFFIAFQIAPIFTDGNVSVFSSFGNTIENLIYLPNGAFIGQFWSLTYEVIFYLLVPFLIINKRFYYLFSVLIYIWSFYTSWNYTVGHNIVTMYLFDYNIYFAVGIYIFHNYERIYKNFLFEKNYLLYSILSFIFLAMVVVKFKTTEENKVSMLLAILFSIILIVNFLQKEISCKILDFLGNMSYTLYITHLATIYLFKSLLFNFEVINSSMISQWYIWPIGVIIAIIVSFLIYQIAEKPSKILLQNIRNKKNVLKFA